MVGSGNFSNFIIMEIINIGKSLKVVIMNKFIESFVILNNMIAWFGASEKVSEKTVKMNITPDNKYEILKKHL